MTIRRGISILDLLDIPAGSQNVLSGELATQFDRLVVVDHVGTVSDTAYIHHGTIISDDELDLPLGIELPGLNTGLPFQLTLTRVAVSGSQTLEPETTSWHLDLILTRVSLEVPGLRPARYVDASGNAPAHLDPDSSREHVRITGGAILRFQSGSGIKPRFIDSPDPFDPETPTGAVATLTFDPPHFFLGSSAWGMTVDRLTYDGSETYTPPEVVARGHDGAWRGIVIREATLYCPPGAPLVGDFSAGVRDVILGDPLGIQGELRLEFGAVNVPDFVPTFEVVRDSGPNVALITDGAVDRARKVQLLNSERSDLLAKLASGSARWHLPPSDLFDPDSASTAEGGSVTFVAGPGDVLRVQPISEKDDPTPEIRYTFVPPPGGITADLTKLTTAPTIDATLGTHTYHDVVHASGTAEQLAKLTFTPVLPPATPTAVIVEYGWEIAGRLGMLVSPTYGSSADSFPTKPGAYKLILTERHSGLIRFLAIEVLASGKLLVGAIDGVHDGVANPDLVEAGAVVAMYDVNSFHQSGTLRSVEGDAPVRGTDHSITVAPGLLVELQLEPGAGSAAALPPPPPLPEPPRYHAVRYASSVSDPTEVLAEAMRADIESYDGAHYLVIGRTDDLWKDEPYLSNAARQKNAVLGRDRATKLASLIGQWIGDATRVSAFGEQDAATVDALFQPAFPVPAPTSLPTDPYGLPKAGNSTTAPDNFLILREHADASQWGPGERPERAAARRVDVFTVGGTRKGTAPQPVLAGEDDRANTTRRHMLVPGPDKPFPELPQKTIDQATNLNYRVRLRVVWDSPTVATLADAIPTLAELTVAWKKGDVQLPHKDDPNGVVKFDNNATAEEFWTVVGRWSTDPQNGQTLFSLALDSTGDPNGLASTEGTSVAHRALAAGLAFGPALVHQATGADPFGARLFALIGVLGAAIALSTKGKVVIHGIKVEHEQKSLDDPKRGHLRAILDYSVELEVDRTFASFHIKTEKPLRFRYRRVGIDWDHTPGLELSKRFRLIYDNASFEVEHPGTWTFDGALGKLLRVVSARVGAGSIWFEIDMAFLLDLGVITVTGATVRLTFHDGDWSFDLRGLAVKLDVPGVVKGEGRLAIGADGAIRSAIDVTVVPLKVQARAALAIDADFVSLEVAVLFPIMIPVAPGFGINGFLGRFVMNGTRSLPASPGDDDPIGRELAWYAKPPEQKYQRKHGQWVVGLGVVGGTLPDSGYTFNVAGMLTVELPELLILLGIDASFLSKPALPTDSRQGSSSTAIQLTGLISIDKNALRVGIIGRYNVKGAIDARVPFGAFFPFGAGDSFLRIGADNAGSPRRGGDPVTITFLPGTLDARAWSFLMLEQRQLHDLGGVAAFDLDGFSIGFGAGFDVRWGPLSASASVLLGLGTQPFLLVGQIKLRGEISIRIFSISVSALITLKALETSKFLDGEVCAEVDLFFHTIKACAHFSIGSDLNPGIPKPPSPLLAAHLVDRHAIVTGRAVLNGTPAGSDVVEQNSIVWPDTIPVLQFSHSMLQGLPAGSQFAIAPPMPGTVWSGTAELKYAYRIASISLLESATGAAVAGPLDGSWWLPTHRPGLAADTAADGGPSENEGSELALLTWHPFLWARNLGDGTEGLPGHPVQTVGRVCDPTPKPKPNCALGQLATRTGSDTVTLRPPAPTPAPFPNWFIIEGRETFQGRGADDVAMLQSAAGHAFIAGRVAQPDADVEPGYQLATIRNIGRLLSTLQFDGAFAPAIEQASLTLLVCPEARQEPEPPKNQQCDDFTHLAPGTSLKSDYEHNGFKYAPTEEQLPMRITQDGDAPELSLPSGAVFIDLPQRTNAVRMQVGAPRTATQFVATAFDENNKVVKTAIAIMPAGTRREVALEAEGITRVFLQSGGGAVLSQTCIAIVPVLAPAGSVTAGVGQVLPTPIDPGEPQQGRNLPVVIGTTTGGEDRQWGGVVEQRDADCFTVTYEPRANARWKSVRVAPFVGGTITVLRACGVSADAVDAAKADQDARDAMVDDWNDRADKGTPARNTILKADTAYEVRVTWEYQGWSRSSGGSTPSLGTSWSAGDIETFRFRTAPAAPPLPAEPEPVNFVRERDFDPRGVARYFLGLVPGDGIGVPHFLDDSVDAHFSVDHLEKLLAAYGRTFDLRVVHTNPKTAGGGVPLVPAPQVLTKEIGAALLLPAADAAVLAVVATKPCIRMPSLGGSTYHAQVDLLPDADYDVLLFAAKTGDDVLVARSHFHTSRWRNPRELLDDLGFPQQTNIYPPHEALIAAAPPLDVILQDDAAYEAMLRALDLDPWPVPRAARTTVLWRETVPGTWAVAAVLLEAPEPLERGPRLPAVPLFTNPPPRLTVIGAELDAGGTQVAFIPRRSNAARTAILLVPAAPVTTTAPATLILDLQEPAGIVSGSRFLSPQPVLLEE